MIIFLNGAPRAGKSSIATVIADTFDGNWQVFGVDRFTAELTPEDQLPGIGLRPGGERPDLEPFVSMLYADFHKRLAALVRSGVNVVSDIGYHDGYSAPLKVRASAKQHLAGLPILFVGVRCPLEEIMRRRAESVEGSYVTATPNDPVPLPVQRWQTEVHNPGIYDLEVDTSNSTPEACAETIRQRLASGVPNVAYWTT